MMDVGVGDEAWRPMKMIVDGSKQIVAGFECVVASDYECVFNTPNVFEENVLKRASN